MKTISNRKMTSKSKMTPIRKMTSNIKPTFNRPNKTKSTKPNILNQTNKTYQTRHIKPKHISLCLSWAWHSAAPACLHFEMNLFINGIILSHNTTFLPPSMVKIGLDIVFWIVFTFVSTKLLFIIKNKSNIWIFICILQKQVLASALITFELFRN